ncbi:hypothetical protein L3X38_011486 [Prunus dulcis]|uniref:Uncharacterized protein n=1 Tax=Prunus dulcis TaxID=3755 RepID=A0AAD4WHG3_PRUDU|nr:hypothetical protein L3X38_011486 [Prunus dulcis]
MRHAAIHAKVEHFNSKEVPLAGQDPAPTYDRFSPQHITNQAPYRMAPTVSAPYTTGDKRMDGFQGRQDGGKRNKETSGRIDFRSLKRPRPEEVFTLLNSTYEYVLMAENQKIRKPNNRKLIRQVNKDTRVFCQYHQYNSHDTESCISQ